MSNIDVSARTVNSFVFVLKRTPETPIIAGGCPITAGAPARTYVHKYVRTYVRAYARTFFVLSIAWHR